MINIGLILICLLFGFYLRRYEHFRLHSAAILNALIIDLFLPALIVAYIPGLGKKLLTPAAFFPALMPWLMFLLAWAFAWSLGKAFSWSKETVGCLVLVMGLGNTSFVGFPLLEALYGPSSLSTGIMIDQLGSFLIVATLATVFGVTYSGGQVTAKMMIHRVTHFPPFLALFFSLLITPFGPFPKLSELCLKLSAPMVPLAVMTLAIQIQTSREAFLRNKAQLGLALLFKLLLFPALIALIYPFVFSQRGFETQITIAEAAMAPMFSSSILATRFNLRPELASLIIFVGVLLSLLTVPIWSLCIHWV